MRQPCLLFKKVSDEHDRPWLWATLEAIDENTAENVMHRFQNKIVVDEFNVADPRD
jgi:hypothetical protein